MLCGVYVRVTSPGALSLGDAVTAPEAAQPSSEAAE
jgi:MOSC domain-containing protein YiiM